MKKLMEAIMIKLRKILSFLISVLALAPVCALNTAGSADAVDINTLNSSSVFVKQQQSYTCTLASNVMMLRRAALLRGDSDWQSITEDSCSSVLWTSCGMRFDYTYNNISVDCERIYGNSTETLKKLLSDHPEGIVAYDYDYPHAVLLTDYTNGKFYCSDPARCCGTGRIEATQSLVNTSDIEAYWYVTTNLPKPVVKSVINTSTIDSTSITYGNDIKMNLSASYGSGAYQYEIDANKPSSNNWINLRKYNSSSTYIYHPWETGKYSIRIKAKDSTGAINTKTYTFNVTAPKLNNKSTINKDSIMFGEDITFSLRASGGTGGYQYEVNAKKPGSNQWTNLRKNYTLSSYSYHPWEVGTYELKVICKDNSGNTSEVNFYANIKAEKLVNKSTISNKTISFGSTVDIDLAAQGGSGSYKYEINAVKPSSTNSVNLRKYNPGTVYTYRPWEKGKYLITVNVKDLSGNVKTKTFTLTVK